MKALFYKFILLLLKNYNRFYFRRIRIYGQEHIPKKGGVIFSPNHQGAFLDPLLVGTSCGSKVTSLTRSDVFGGPFQWFLDALKMLPVYRIRDGYSSLRKNAAIFDRCHQILGKGDHMMMFSEGSHHNEYYLQRLSKGSSRLALEAQEKFPDSTIYIVPVGINYSHHQLPWQEVHIVYGKPILVGNFLEAFNENRSATINQLREVLKREMKACLWLPENEEHYLQKKKYINLENTKLGFYKLREQLLLDPKHLKTIENKGSIGQFWISLFSLPNLLPLIGIGWVVKLFPDIVFHNSIKYMAGLFIFAFWWKILIFSGTYIYGISIGISLFIGSIFFLYLRQMLISKYKSN